MTNKRTEREHRAIDCDACPVADSPEHLGPDGWSNEVGYTVSDLGNIAFRGGPLCSGSCVVPDECAGCSSAGDVPTEETFDEGSSTGPSSTGPSAAEPSNRKVGGPSASGRARKKGSGKRGASGRAKRIESYSGPNCDIDRVVRTRHTGPIRKGRDIDWSKPLDKCTNYEIGRRGEDLACQYLESHGYAIVERNFRCRFGEADIVARGDDPQQAVLVEVKSRVVRGKEAESIPELAVNFAKQRRYEKIGLYYYALHPEVDGVRFDVIALNMVDDGRRENHAQLRHLVGAFVWDDGKAGDL